MRGITLLAALLALAACSPMQWYTAGRQWQRDSCLRLPEAAQRERCLRDAAMPFETYQRERQPVEPRP